MSPNAAEEDFEFGLVTDSTCYYQEKYSMVVQSTSSTLSTDIFQIDNRTAGFLFLTRIEHYLSIQTQDASYVG